MVDAITDHQLVTYDQWFLFYVMMQHLDKEGKVKAKKKRKEIKTEV